MIERVRGTLTVLRALPGQRRVPFLPAEQIVELRDARVREIVAYAAETVPYYRDLFAREGIDPRDIRSADDLACLPLIDKDQLHENPDLLRSESAAGRNAIRFQTSGYTTGTPVDILHDRQSLLRNIAFSERERAVEAAFCGKRVRYVAAELRYGPGMVGRVRAIYDRAAFRPLRPRHHPLSTELPLEQIIDAINRLRPDVVRSYGTYLETLFRIVAARGIRMHLPKVLVYAGDGMTREGRHFIEEHFGVPVLSRYNAVEALKIGFFCEKRNGFHLHEDLCHVVVVSRDGRPAAPRQTGEVVISNLVNRGTVLLNYRLGDLGSMSDLGSISSEPCACNRTSRRLVELRGRLGAIVHLPNGGFLHEFVFWGVVKAVEGVIRYQLVQHEPARFELKLMTVDRGTFDRVVDGLVAQVRELIPGAGVEATYHELLEPDRSGKFRPVVPLGLAT